MNPRVPLRWVKKYSIFLILIGSLAIPLFLMKMDAVRTIFSST